MLALYSEFCWLLLFSLKRTKKRSGLAHFKIIYEVQFVGNRPHANSLDSTYFWKTLTFYQTSPTNVS